MGVSAAIIATLAGRTAFAELPGSHPAYLHSRSDLRMAEALLRYQEEAEFMRALEKSAGHIHRAIEEIDRAIELDHKPLADNPHIDVARFDRGGRLKEIERLINGAIRDLDIPEDHRPARERRDVAREHLRAAIGDVEAARHRFVHVEVEAPAVVVAAPEVSVKAVIPGISVKAVVPGVSVHAAVPEVAVSVPAPAVVVTAPAPVIHEHPHYLHALSDLRLARAFLEHPAERNVMRNQDDAIGEIDMAIREIKRAAIDDHKDLADHVPIDARLDHRGRLQKVMSLLDSVERDLRFEEDDQFALGWRALARHHVAEAHRFSGRALEDQRIDRHY